MSYLVLARRWRPQKFSDLVGQDVVVRTLKNALSSGNLAHAYLLCGIRGVGKTTIARLMAMAVNCESPVNGEPCGSCTACRGIASGSNLDVQEMDAASHTGVDDVREILDGVRYPPSTLKFKVYVIDEAHMLSKSAFNALLKTLEEPPARVLFILATTESEKLPVTVRSRCQRFDLRRLGQREIGDYLAHVFASEKVTADSDAVSVIAEAADGSVRDALSLAERVLAYSSDGLSIADVQSALGLVRSDLVRRLSQALFAGGASTAVEVLRVAVAQGHSPKALLLELNRLWHQLSCIKVDAELLGEEVDAGLHDWLEKSAEVIDLQALDLRYQVLLSGIRDLGVVDERIGSEMVLMRLCGLNSISPLGDIEIDLLPEAVKEKADVSEAVAPQSSMMFVPEPEELEESPTLLNEPQEPEGSEIKAEPDLPIQEQPEGREFDNWQQAVEEFGKVKPGMAAMLEHVLCVEFGSKVRLALSKHQERAIAAADRLVFSEWLGRELFWESQKDHDGESLSQERDRLARADIARLRKAAQDDPHVQALMRELDAQLVKVLPPGVQPDDRLQ